jgi:prolyl 4-hydroxylase
MNYLKDVVFDDTKLYECFDAPSESNIITKHSPNLKIIVPSNLWIVDNFLSKEECDSMIKLIEEKGFDDATVNIGAGNYGVIDKDFRDCKRCMIDDFKTSEIIIERIKNILPIVNEGGILSSVNERFRFLKYFPGNKFKNHSDGLFERKLTDHLERSVFTIQIYLNEETTGGETIFFNEDLFEETDGIFKCEPKKGRIVIFRQFRFEHCGAEVIEGIKYTVRTDIMYRNCKIKKDEEVPKLFCNFCETDVKYVNCPQKFSELVGICGCGNSLNKKQYSENYYYCVTCGYGTVDKF